MRTIRNKHYENEDRYIYLVEMRIIHNKHYENEDEKNI